MKSGMPGPRWRRAVATFTMCPEKPAGARHRHRAPRALVIGALGALVGLYPWIGAVPVVVAAFVGTTFESLVGAALEKRQLLDNEALNFLNTLVGALVAAAFSPWVVS